MEPTAFLMSTAFRGVSSIFDDPALVVFQKPKVVQLPRLVVRLC